MLASHYPLWAGGVTTVLCFALASQAGKHNGFYRQTVQQLRNEPRYGELDGLRAFLAFAVVLTHAASSIGWYRTGVWTWPDSVFYTLCGRVPVTLFFMITGFLFSHKLMSARRPVIWRRLYLSRLRRLAPLYLFVTAAMFLVVGQKTGWQHVPQTELAKGVFKWLSLGILGHTDLNGLAQSWTINPAMWTLRYEWIFYTLLPLLSLFLTSLTRLWAAAAIVLLLIYGLHVLDAVSLNFVFGAFAAFVYNIKNSRSTLQKRSVAVGSLILLAATAHPFARNYGVLQSLLVFPLFICALYGNSFFGMLASRPAQVLGLASYSVYLNHGVMLYGGLQLANLIWPVTGMSSIFYSGVVLAIGLATTCASLITFRFFEYPFMSTKRKPVEVDVAVKAEHAGLSA